MVFENRYEVTEAELRMECLNMATMVAPTGSMAATVINMAEEFKKYIEGT